MKKLLLSLFFVVILTTGYGQSVDYKKNEISVGIIHVAHAPKSQEILFVHLYYVVPINNITYKRWINKNNAIRLTYYRPITRSNEKPPDNWNDNSDYKEQVFRIGYEYIFDQKKFTPYLALDMTYLTSTSSRVVGGGFTGEMNQFDNNKNGVGVTPTIGINYHLFKNIYIGAESNLSIMNMKNEKISTKLFPVTNELPAMENTSSIESIFNPIQVIVKIKF